MQGAKQYYNLFGGKSQQIGRLFFQLSTHARGKCFEIFVLPEGVKVATDQHIGGTKDAIGVYGVISGQRGWTEAYGWIHKGKWQNDFNTIVEQKKTERETVKLQQESEKEVADTKAKDRVSRLLSNYT